MRETSSFFDEKKGRRREYNLFADAHPNDAAWIEKIIYLCIYYHIYWIRLDLEKYTRAHHSTRKMEMNVFWITNRLNSNGLYVHEICFISNIQFTKYIPQRHRFDIYSFLCKRVIWMAKWQTKNYNHRLKDSMETQRKA